MSSTPSCCATLFAQYQQQATRHIQHCKDQPCADAKPFNSQTCTVVEDGRVVVKPCPQPQAGAEQA